MAKGLHGAAKGPGNGNPPRRFTKDNAAEMGRKGGLVGGQERVRRWREAHPHWAESPPSDKELQDYLSTKDPDIADKVVHIALDDTHPKQFEAAKVLFERRHGRPRQAVELTGRDGGGIEINDTRDRIARRIAGLAAGGNSTGDPN